MSTANMVRMRLFLIEGPVRMKRRQAVGSLEGSVKRVLVELTDTEGCVGCGEAASWEMFTGTCEAALDVLREERLPRRDGAVVTPDGPGFGIEVSESAIRHNARIVVAL